MIDFPASPTVGQVFIDPTTNLQWVWDGTKWKASGLSTPPLPVPMGDNRIINGDMRIDQRNNGAGGTAINVYTADRWQYLASQTSKLTWQRGGPTNFQFQYAWAATSSSAYTPLAADYFTLAQTIEADMVGDFMWGTSSAQPVTLSFWVYCSLAGTFGGAIRNAANNRSFPFTYSVTATTWTKIVIAIPGDTTGTWVLFGNAASMNVIFDLGSGASNRAPAGAWLAGNFLGANGSANIVATNGATFYVTGVKLEIGSVATPYNRQSLAKSMADCQRYYSWTSAHAVMNAVAAGNYISTTASLPVSMRAPPTITTGAMVAAVNLTGFTADNIFNNSFRCYGQAVAAGVTAFDQYMFCSAEL